MSGSRHGFGVRLRLSKDGPTPRRIGELLKAFDGDWVRSDILEMVAHAHQYQEDWQKRLRELRVLGWEIDHEKRRESGRVRTYYRVTRWRPRPSRPIRSEIRRRDQRRNARRKLSKT
jgi:hypothetical protein